jgi:hypothetical protein
MNSKLDGKVLYIPREDPIANTLELRDCIPRAGMGLFNHNGQGVAVTADGELAPLSLNLLRERIPQHIVVERLVQQADGKWQVEYQPFAPEELVLRAVYSGTAPGRHAPGTNAPELPGGGLVNWLPKG